MIPLLSNSEACKLALKHRLFVSGWMMNAQLHMGAKRENSILLAAVYLERDIPVGVTVVTAYNDIQVFVRKSERRKGIGLKLVEHARKTLPPHQAKRIDAGQGTIAGSGKFWIAANVPRYD